MADFDFSEFNNIDNDDEFDFDEKFYNDIECDTESEIDDELTYFLNRKPKYRRIETKKKCSESGCERNAYYHLRGDNNFYCGVHRTEMMVNPKRKVCTEENCAKPAYYAFEGQIATKCSVHKDDGMINLAKKVCSQYGCKIYPSYNYLNVKDRYYGDRCKNHKLDGMVDIRNPKCTVEGCNLFARFYKKTRCYTHKHVPSESNL